MIRWAAGVGCTSSANICVCAASGAIKVACVHVNALTVVHAGVVTLVKPNADGLAWTSLKSRLMLIGTISTLREAKPLCSVELYRFESAVNGADGVESPRGVLPMSARLKTMIVRAPASRK